MFAPLLLVCTALGKQRFKLTLLLLKVINRCLMSD